VPDVGDVLDGYRLDAVIGRGGMGTVYRATDTALEKTVALKVIAPHLADDATFVQRFREEAKALARLDADGIVEVYTLRETEDALFFVMEYLEGPSLQTVLRRRGALAPSAALSLVRQVLEAVGHAHRSGVLHRDLKPSNILLDEDGRAVITDFGLAKILASDADLTATHEQLGTVAYMSPEQVQGLQNVDEKSDLFSVGLIAYEAYTGRLPFDRSESDFVVQRALVEDAFPPPSTFAPEVPPAVEQVILDLLAKDPGARPPDAQTALDRLPQGESDAGTALLTSPPRTASASLSGPQWIALAAAVVVLLFGIYAGVRGTLGLPILSTSAPAPPDTMRLQASAPQDSLTPTPRGGDVSRGPTSAPGGATPTNTESSPPTTDASTSPNAESPASTVGSPAPESTVAESNAPSAERTDPPPSPTPTTNGETGSAESPSRGVLSVRSEPAGAAIRLGDSRVGRTPLTIDDLEPGPRRLRLQLQSYRPYDTSVAVGPGDTLTVAPSLTPRPAVVRLRALPSGEVEINGTRYTTGPDASVIDSLPPGSHRITVTSPLGRWETNLQLNAGEQYERTVDFTKQVDVAVTARSADGGPLPNASVRVNGETVGYTPQRLSLRVGLHTIQLEKAGYESVTREVLVEADMDTPVVFELSPDSE
jgi:serine/threonine protein kinase